MSDRRRFNAVFAGRESRTGVSEGLNVLFADLIRSLVALGVPVAIFTTDRHVAGLAAILRANGVDEQAVDIQPLIRGSRVLNKVWSGLPEVKRVGLRTRISQRLSAALRADRLAARVAWLLDGSTAMLPLKILWLLVAAIVGVLLVGMGSLLILAVSVFYVGYVLFRRGARIGTQVASKFIRNRNGEPLTVTAHHLRLWLDRFRPMVYEQLYKRESNQLAAALNARRDIGTCFFHNAFEGYIVGALSKAKKKLVVFPDAVPALFPTRYPLDRYARVQFASFATSIGKADAVICYSNFVRDRQLNRFLRGSVAGKRVEVIPQGFFLGRSASNASSVEELNRLVKPIAGGRRPQGELQFGSFDYVLYPSVDRPHKNTLTLLKAVEHLIRSRQANIKLITTSAGITDDLRNYIEKRHLEREVIFMPRLSIERLNSLIEGALAVVHPSLAEGGDIFNFSRAASHGCPAILSDIEVAREMFERHGIGPSTYRGWLFNPVSAKELAEKIIDVRARRAAYVKEQKEALRSLSTYSFEDMARRYYEFYCSL